MARDAITTYSASRVFTKKPEGLTSGYEQSFRKYPEVPTHTLLPSSWAVKIIGERIPKIVQPTSPLELSDMTDWSADPLPRVANLQLTARD